MSPYSAGAALVAGSCPLPLPLASTSSAGQLETHPLLDPVLDLELDGIDLPQPGDEVLHQLLGCRRAGGDAHAAHAVEPRRVEVAGIVDQVGRHPHLLADLPQPGWSWSCCARPPRG